MAYSNDPKEPGLYWGGFGNTFSAWHYNPYNLFYSTIKDNLGKPVDIDKEYKTMERLKPKYMSNIIGVQAQLWSETVKGQSMMEYMLLPKLIGFAETAWAKQREWETTVSTGIRANQVAKDWNIFANSITQNELPRLSTLFGGFNYRIPPPGAKFENGFLHANVEFPGLEIRYSTNGDEPTINSSIYTKPVKVSDSIIHIKSFDIAGRGSRTVILKTN
jgi:hexosaminidase